MTFDIVRAEQRSPAWFAARLGRLTGTGAAAMLSEGRTKGTRGETGKKLLDRLVTELLTGLTEDDLPFVTPAIQRGIDCEPLARCAYEAETGLCVHQTGFLSARDLRVGCSLDGHVGAFEGIVEIKCPNSRTHKEYLRSGQVPADYLPQIRHNLWVSGAAWCDFVSYDPRLPHEMRLFTSRVERDDKVIADLERTIEGFLAELDEKVARLCAVYGRPSTVIQLVA